MKTWKLINLCWQVFLLQKKPQDMPHSKTLMWVLAVIFILLNIPSNVIFSEILTKIYLAKGLHAHPLTNLQSFFCIVVYTLILLSTIYSLLTYYKLQARLVQVLNSLFAVEIFLSIWFFALALIPELHLLFTMMFFALIFWQFVVNIYIFTNSLDTSIYKSAMFALLYSLVQHNVDELLLVVFMQRG